MKRPAIVIELAQWKIDEIVTKITEAYGTPKEDIAEINIKIHGVKFELTLEQLREALEPYNALKNYERYAENR